MVANIFLKKPPWPQHLKDLETGEDRVLNIVRNGTATTPQGVSPEA